jgi:hypothetical protein
MKSWKIVVLILGGLINVAYAQLTVPQAEGVYGGRISDIAGISFHNDSSRIVISTESANSLFYADFYMNGTPVYSDFMAVPGADDAADYGSNVHHVEIHEASEMIFFVAEGHGLLSTDISSTTVNSIVSGMPSALKIVGDYMLYFDMGSVWQGSLDPAGNYTSGASVNLPPITDHVEMAISPVDSSVYILERGVNPKLYKLSDKFDQITVATVFADISPAGLSAAVTYEAIGVAPDGRIFIGGTDDLNKYIAYTDDEISWNEYASGIGGVNGRNFDFSGSASSYYVYFANSYNDNNGVSAADWDVFGVPGGYETHPNDGAVFADPLNSNVVYMTTDMGLGCSEDMGSTIFEINEGVIAVRVSDIDMDSTKNVGWVASKSGIRKVSDYQSTPIWSVPMYPWNDGSPYYSADMNPGDTNVAYVGNVRVYKTVDGGLNWDRKFTPEDPPYNYSNIGTNCEAIEVCVYDTNIVFAGFSIWDTDKGGVFYSHDAGQNWDQLLLEESTVGQDVDVNDIVFNLEGSDTVAYIGVSYDLAATTGRSVYRAVKSGTTWLASQDMNAGGTSTGSVIVATINDLDVSPTGDTVVCAGTDAGINHPIAYYKEISGTNLWTPFTTTGFPFSPGKEASAITIGIDTVYCAVDHELYLMKYGATSWLWGSTYPNGTVINVLYWDELLVGTGTGLYSQYGDNTISIEETVSVEQDFLVYPNPGNGIINVEMKETIQVEGIIIFYDVLGRIVEQVKLNNNTKKIQLDITDKPKGIYILEIRQNNKSKLQELIIKN